MGRKSAPKSLELADAPPLSREEPHTGETYYSSISSLPHHSQSSRSPRTPLSPLRFHHKNSHDIRDQSIAGGHFLHHLTEPPPYPAITSALQQPHHIHHFTQLHHQSHQPHLLPPHSPPPPPPAAATALPSSNSAPAPASGPSLAPQSLDDSTLTSALQSRLQHSLSHKSSYHHENNKPSKSGFGFNFTKPSRSTNPSDRVNTTTNTHPRTDSSRAGAMSRDAEVPVPPSSSNTKHADLDPTSATATTSKVETSAPPSDFVSSMHSTSEVSLASNMDHEVANGNGSNSIITSSSTVSVNGTILNSSKDSSKKGKQKSSFPLLKRTRSSKGKESPSPKAKEFSPIVRVHHFNPLKTAPVIYDRSLREMVGSSARTNSTDRSQNSRDRSSDGGRYLAINHGKDDRGSFMMGLKNSSSRAADMISKGLFGKTSRGNGGNSGNSNGSGSGGGHNDKDDDDNYVISMNKLPLVEQTRRTRISKRLEESRDKTEFWMPAFPWRAIDYLNYKGSDVEGLYRVPGSGPQIKKWQRKFDEEGDLDLFEQEDLYDINIIGSMLKAWIRELPDELFPKETQEKIARECVGAETVPSMLVEELSNLSPFKYYLLFAITCHLSLLLAHSDQNKMDYRNLCICFQPCMRIDTFCFKFLVCDWRDCWQGCKNEAQYILEEYALFDQPPPTTINMAIEASGNNGNDSQSDARDGCRSSISSDNSHATDRPKGRKSKSADGEKKKRSSSSSRSRSAEPRPGSSAKPNFTLDRVAARGRSRDTQKLSPIKPLSPLHLQ